MEASGWLDSELSCNVFYGLYLENKRLILRTQLQDKDGENWEEKLLVCGADPNVVLASSIGGSLAGALLLLLSKFI